MVFNLFNHLAQSFHMYKSEFSKIEGVYRFKIDVPFEVKFVCIYLLKIDNKNVLIDAGLNLGDWSKVFFSVLNDAKLNIKDIDYCIISHAHLDHVGLLKKFKRKNPNLQILMHDITNEILKWSTDPENFKEIEISAEKMAQEMIKYGISDKQGKRISQFFTSWPKMIRYQKPDMLLHDGDEITFGTNKLKIIWTPGHSFGHICVFDQNKQHLFSGDHILSEITPHIGVFNISPALKDKYNFNNILGNYLESLDRIDKLNPKIIFPGHQKIIYNPHRRILDIKEHHKNRLKEIFDLIVDKPLTPHRISQIHFGEDLDEMNGFLALNEVLSHLIYLEHQEKVKRIEGNNKILFIAN